jgi:hypothetical protein
MWQLDSTDVERGKRLQISSDGKRLSFRELFALLERNPEFATWYTERLCASGAEGFFWQHPALTEETFDGDAELVLIDGPALAKLVPDPEPFRRHFEKSPNDEVIVFANLGGDAVLIVPRPLGPTKAYGHLAAFLRRAPSEQVLSLWRNVGQTVRESIGPEPQWVNTAGMGVPWLHVRIDSRPKYYRYAPYKAFPRRG